VVLFVSIIGATGPARARIRAIIHRDSRGYFRMDDASWFLATNDDAILWRDHLADRAGGASVVVCSLSRGWALHRSPDLAEWLRDVERFF
jgi:hypothetical protein